MKKEYYDHVFFTSKHYRGPPEESPYYVLWKAVLSLFKEKEKFLDVGCGPGQFGELCVKAGHLYTGIDYSPVAIKLGKQKGYGEYFEEDVEKDTSRIEKGDYTVLSLIEFLEHIPEDREVIRAAPSGKTVVFSVPSYGSLEHVRFFENIEAVTNRYISLIIPLHKLILTGSNGGEIRIFVVKGERR